MLTFYAGEIKPIGKKIIVDTANSAQNLEPWEIKDAQYFIYKDNIQVETGKCTINNDEKLIYHWFNAKTVGLYKITYIVNLNPNISKFTNYVNVV